jgi:polysaccharide pyruvyl transferase WcaK-like protein
MRIVLRGAGFENKGAEAMTRVVQKEIGKRVGGATFHARLCPEEVQLGRRAGLHVPVVRGGRLGKAAMMAMAALRSGELRRLAKVHAKAALEIATCGRVDGVIDISGFVYGDSFGASPAKYAWAWIGYCNERRRPYVFFPQAWGPFTDPVLAGAVKDMCQKASAVYVRDVASHDYLNALLADTGRGATLAPDIVFRFEGASPAEGAQVLASHGIEVGARPIIGISPNMRVYERMPGTGASNAYVGLMAEAAKLCVRELGASVVLIPNEIRPVADERQDDRFLCKAIAEAAGTAGPVAAMCGEYSAEIVKAVIEHVELLVASRFHSLVFALSSAVPSVAVGWSHKYVELMTFMGMEEYVVGHDQVSQESLFAMIRNAWAARSASRQILQQRLPGVRQAVDRVFDHTADLLLGRA